MIGGFSSPTLSSPVLTRMALSTIAVTVVQIDETCIVTQQASKSHDAFSKSHVYILV